MTEGSPNRPLKVGIELPIAENKGRVGVPRWADISAMARLAEQAGFDSLWVEDHLLFRYDGGAPQGVWEGWSMLTALAATTERVELGPLVSCASFRNPALTAKMADTVDEISGGRLILGLGAGWHEPEYRAFGFPFDHRVSRFEEALQIIHGLLRTGAIDFEGTYYTARECELRPRGPRPQGPPILLGTVGERMLRLTAKYADLWNAYFSMIGNRPDGVAPLRARIDAACAEVGRDPATLGRTAAVLVHFPGGEGGRGMPSHWQVPPLTGSPAEMAAELRAFAREGIGHIILWLEPNTIESVERFAPVLEELDRG
jgi:probable F420-dependent oxidoreductase